jgi:hypothetical protein
MGAIAEIFRQFGPEYLAKFDHHLPENHRKVIDAISRCRTEACGVNVFTCTICQRSIEIFQSCGNRHCPSCQQHKTRQWLEKQLHRELPGHHFMITFTVPEQLRRFMRSHQQKSYAALFAASSTALKKLAREKKFVGGDLPGFFGILHTWGRQLEYHPHIHYIVPGGAFAKTGGFWRASPRHFFAPVLALSKIFRAAFRDEMIKAGLFDQINPAVWKLAWNVNSQAVGRCEGSLKYLAPYVFKVAISDSRIVGVAGRRVVFRYKKQKSSRWRTLDLDALEFIRRYLQHVLPTGFMKIRYYGFLGSGSTVTLDDVRTAIERSLDTFVAPRPESRAVAPHYPYCPHCRGRLVFGYKLAVGEGWNPG